MPTPTLRDCIVVSGKKYCEDTNLSKQEISNVCFGMVLIILYLSFFIWLCIKFDDYVGWIIPSGLILPFLVIGIICL